MSAEFRELMHRGGRRILEGSPDEASSWLRWTLIPFVPLYRGGRALHQLYRGWRVRGLPRPVVSVGNLRLGGTGKTPFVIWLVGELLRRDCRPAVLKRGTGRETGTLVAPRGEDSAELADRYGDEAALIHHRHPGVPVGVGPDRHQRGHAILAEHPVDVFVLDDGFQRRNLRRDLDVVLLGGLSDLDQWQLPAGPLREPPSALERAHYVSLNTTLDEPDGRRFTGRIGRYTNDRATIMTHAYRMRGIFRDDRDVTGRYRGRSADLLTTQARPERLVRFLEKQGIRVRRRFHHPDHASWDSLDLGGGIDPEELLVTPKEWIKLPDGLRGRVNRIESELKVRPARPLIRSVESLTGDDTGSAPDGTGEVQAPETE